MARDELDDLFRDRFDLGRADIIFALRHLPARRPWATRLTAGESTLLDAAGFTEDGEAYAQVAADATAHMGRLYNTAYTAAEVASGLGVNASRVRQRRLAHTLWALDDGGTWVYPAAQFDLIDGPAGSRTLRSVRGLERVLPHLMSKGLHPTAVSAFFHTPRSELTADGVPTPVREWLLRGEAVEPVLRLIEVGDWAGA